jgi:hypothetical protein
MQGEAKTLSTKATPLKDHPQIPMCRYRIEVFESYQIEEKEKTAIQMSLFKPKRKYAIKAHNKKIQRTQKARPLI